jgi:hypothetical protein
VRCNAGGESIVHRYPRELRGRKDHEMMPVILTGDRTLLTTDRKMVEDHTDCIPDSNPGVVLVKTINSKRPLTSATVSRIIDNFKSRFPSWASTDLRNTYLEMDETGVYISRLHKEYFSSSVFVDINDAEFATRLVDDILLTKGSDPSDT